MSQFETDRREEKYSWQKIKELETKHKLGHPSFQHSFKAPSTHGGQRPTQRPAPLPSRSDAPRPGVPPGLPPTSPHLPSVQGAAIPHPLLPPVGLPSTAFLQPTSWRLLCVSENPVAEHRPCALTCTTATTNWAVSSSAKREVNSGATVGN